MLSGGIGGRFYELSRGNPPKVLNPQLAPKGAGLGFFTFPLFWGQRSDRLPFLCGLDLSSTRVPLFLRSGPP